MISASPTGPATLSIDACPATPIAVSALTMPQTVPKSPTNGAVEPTVARNARPSCERLCTLSIARWIDIEIQSLRSTLPSMPSCLPDASSPVSAMNRYGLFFFKVSAPWRTEGAFQNVFSAAFACVPILACS